MKTMIPVVLGLLVVLVAAPAMGGEDVQARKVFNETAIAQEIADCHRKSDLRASRSANLRMQGHREASKALFLETHKSQLVEAMLALGVTPKTYKVQLFLNDRFRCTCYAQWAPPDRI